MTCNLQYLTNVQYIHSSIHSISTRTNFYSHFTLLLCKLHTYTIPPYAHATTYPTLLTSSSHTNVRLHQLLHHPTTPHTKQYTIALHTHNLYTTHYCALWRCITIRAYNTYKCTIYQSSHSCSPDQAVEQRMARYRSGQRCWENGCQSGHPFPM